MPDIWWSLRDVYLWKGRGELIEDLERRRRYWDIRTNRAPYDTHDMTDSLPYPFECAGVSLTTLFRDKDVLEIGPGNGRQYERLRGIARSYCIADIAPDGLDEPAFNDIAPDRKFLLEDWGQSLGRTFDVIHFWYVLHHIIRNEMTDFFTFVSNHLRKGGAACFNCPEPTNMQGTWSGDGMGTTYSDPIIVRCAIMDLPLSVVMNVRVGMKSTGYVFMLQKRHL